MPHWEDFDRLKAKELGVDSLEPVNHFVGKENKGSKSEYSRADAYSWSRSEYCDPEKSYILLPPGGM